MRRRSFAATGSVLILAVLAACSGSTRSSEPDTPDSSTIPAPVATAAPESTTTTRPTAVEEPQIPCIPSGDDRSIQQALDGEGAQAVLCPDAVFELGDTIRLTADNQQIYTQGLPTDGTRALLRVAGDAVATAVAADAHSGVALRNVIIDGNRPQLGSGAGALVEWGGAASGQLVEWVRAYEPRGWSIIYIGEGDGHLCTDAVVRNNEVGPAGRADFGMADGISLACRDSLVEDNTIYDVTDGGIVVFQAPGSLVTGNTIRADSRIMFYGISMEDYGPYDGDFTGTRVTDNVIDAGGALIRRGIAMGPGIGCIPDEELTLRSRGAVVTGNVLRGDNMGYGFVAAGVEDWTAVDNVDRSTHRVPPREEGCFGRVVDHPAGFQINASVSRGVFQEEFVDSVLGFTTSWWSVQPVASKSCLQNLVGAATLDEIAAGDRGPLMPALEATPQGALLEQCVDTYEVEVPVESEDVVVLTVDPCEPQCAQVTLLNLSPTATIDLSTAEFFVEMFPVACEGLPPNLPP
ncbi:MAG: right-handed parallel beta-helix repeat-containing protein, partial [Acidimicrobiia bacterium]